DGARVGNEGMGDVWCGKGSSELGGGAAPLPSAWIAPTSKSVGGLLSDSSGKARRFLSGQPHEECLPLLRLPCVWRRFGICRRHGKVLDSRGGAQTAALVWDRPSRRTSDDLAASEPGGNAEG